jgi:hypothetical protein
MPDRNDYMDSLEIMLGDHSFYAILMAAMRKADSDNLDLLEKAFPEVYQELLDRYSAPGGYLKGEDSSTGRVPDNFSTEIHYVESDGD